LTIAPRKIAAVAVTNLCRDTHNATAMTVNTDFVYRSSFISIPPFFVPDDNYTPKLKMRLVRISEMANR